jgi:transcriptional regulator with XRE-family HTH domain
MQAKQLGLLIHYHRKRAGLTQEELAKHAQVSRYVVQDLEAGTGRTTWSKLVSVLEVLNLRLQPVGPLVGEWEKGEAGKGSEGGGS